MTSPLASGFYFWGNYAKIKPETAKEILTKVLEDQLPNVTPTQLITHPKGNQAFVYKCATVSDDSFRIDGRWWLDSSSKKSSIHGVQMHYFYIVTEPLLTSTSKQASHSTQFWKIIFTLIDQGRQIGVSVLIWYGGDENIEQNVVHGNSKVDRPYLPTLPSFRSSIKKELLLHRSNKKALIALKKSALEIDRK